MEWLSSQAPQSAPLWPSRHAVDGAAPPRQASLSAHWKISIGATLTELVPDAMTTAVPCTFAAQPDWIVTVPPPPPQPATHSVRSSVSQGAQTGIAVGGAAQSLA
jgi:hypothetical protein